MMRLKERRRNKCFCNKSNVRQSLHMGHAHTHTHTYRHTYTYTTTCTRAAFLPRLFREGFRKLPLRALRAYRCSHTLAEDKAGGLSPVVTLGPEQRGTPAASPPFTPGNRKQLCRAEKEPLLMNVYKRWCSKPVRESLESERINTYVCVCVC